MIDHPEVETFRRIAGLLAQNKWAEANAGNMSVRLEHDEVKIKDGNGEEFTLEDAFPSLDGMYFLVTATKGRMRNLPRDPAGNMGLVKILDGGKRYRCLWGKGPATSEFPSHLTLHTMCITERPEMKAILHTHPPHLITMTHLPDMQDKTAINDALKRVHPEVPILMPSGVALSDYRIPGSMALAGATLEALRSCDMALWAMHGVVSLATDLEAAYDHIEIYEKAAWIYLTILSTGRSMRGLSDKQLEEIRNTFGSIWTDK